MKNKTAEQLIKEVERESKKPFNWKELYSRFDKELLKEAQTWKFY